MHGERGTAGLPALCDRYARIPYHRCRSDAESLGLEILWDAGYVLPRVNWKLCGRKLCGPRPDYWWPQVRFIIEIDGDQYHQLSDEDARKQALWEGARNKVARINSHERDVRGYGRGSAAARRAWLRSARRTWSSVT